MLTKQTRRMASLAFGAAIGLSMALPTPADALSKRTKNTIGGAVVGAGVGHLVGGSDGAKAGAVVGAIAGNRKKK
jgi:outer membrane lipoprotein SlyB